MTLETLDEVFGDYRLTHLLGKGGMASVYRAVRSGPMGFAKQVAIKRLHPSLTRDSAILKALVNEARIGGQLKHPNIVEIYEFNRVGDTYYLAREFVDGWTLDRVLQLSRKHEQPLPPSVVLDIVIQSCEGLQYAHTLESLDGTEVHLVHRDLKPANIIVGRKGVAKIMDFGIAKADTNLFKTTLVDTTKGTPHYMSPEQVGGDPTLGPTSDIFALGALLFELTTGKVLFRGDSLASILFAVSRAEVEDQVAEVEAAVPGLGDILARCLQREPTARYPTAKALMDELIAFRDSREAGPWTTSNYLYTLRSKLLEASGTEDKAAGDAEVEFAPLMDHSTGLPHTDELSVEETRKAADAEINRLQSDYLAEALTETVAVDGIDPDLLLETLVADFVPEPKADAKKATRIPQLVLGGVLGLVMLVILLVIGLRAFAPATPEQGSADSPEVASDASSLTAQAQTEPASVEALPTVVVPSSQPDRSRGSADRNAESGDRAVRSRDDEQRAKERRDDRKEKAAPESKAAETKVAATQEPAPETAPPPPPPKPAEPVAEKPRGTGRLGVRASTPSSTVFVDGRLVGKTPLMPISLSAGKHSVRLHCATAGIEATKSISVTIEAGKTLKLGKYNFMTQEWK